MKKGLKFLTLAMLFAMPLAGCEKSDTNTKKTPQEETEVKDEDTDDDVDNQDDEYEDDEEEEGAQQSVVTIDFNNIEGISGKVGAVSFAAAKNGGQNNPVIYDNDEYDNDLRIYAKGTFTLSSETNMSKAAFAISHAGLKRLADISVNTGKVDYNSDNSVVTWTGSAKTVVFTVGDKATHGSEGSSKAGQFCFTKVEVTVSGGGGGSQSDDSDDGDDERSEAAEKVVSYMAEALTDDPTYYKYEPDDQEFYFVYIDEEAEDIVDAAEYAVSFVPEDFYVYTEVEEDEDEDGPFAYGSYINDDNISIDVTTWEENGDIVVQVEVYEFGWIE